MSGEDLTMQAGVGVQQDLALVAWLGLSHVERNGHHYVNGMAALPAEEQAAFLAMHPSLYEHRDGATRLRIVQGELDLSSLQAPGFGTEPRGWRRCLGCDANRLVNSIDTSQSPKG